METILCILIFPIAAATIVYRIKQNLLLFQFVSLLNKYKDSFGEEAAEEMSLLSTTSMSKAIKNVKKQLNTVQ